MTKSEILARDKHIVEVVSGAVYHENGKCINVTMDGVKHSFPEWNFAACKYELFTPEFSWELFKEGLLLVSCNYKEYERFRVGLKAQGLKWRGVDDMGSYSPFSKYDPKSELFGYDGHLYSTSGTTHAIVIQFSSIPSELLKPAFEPRKPETFTKYEWELLTPEERTACNELIRGEIEYDKGNRATNLEWNTSDGYTMSYSFGLIDQLQYRIKPEPEYEPYDKPGPWMIRTLVQLKADNSVIREITGIGYGLVMLSHNAHTVSDMFNEYNHYDLNTGETRPFGKLKGGE